MLKRYIKLIFILLIIMAIGITVTFKVYAVTENNTATFASVKSNDVKPGDNAEIILDLSNIKYESYNIKLSSSAQINTPSVTNAETGENIKNTISTDNNTIANNIEVNQDTNNEETNQISQVNNENSNQSGQVNNNGTEFTISNLNNLDKLGILINVPSTAKIGDKITITITITDSTNEQNTVSNEITLNVVNRDSNNIPNNIPNNTQNNIQDNKQVNDQDKSKMSNKTESKQDIPDTKSIDKYKTSGQQLGSTTQAVTYGGSADNYLTNIYINGNTISDSFNMTNTTYFSTTKTGTTSVDISYDRNDTSSKVCVYGDSGLKSGLNKILISVTAENGSVRYYRIYLTVES